MKKSTRYIVIAMIFIIILFIIYFKYLPKRENATLSQAQLKSNINSIAKRRTNVFANCDIWDESDKKRFQDDNIEIIDSMNKKQRIISIGGSDSIYSNMEPIEVYGIFESWLFVYNKKLPYEVIAICWSYTSGGLDNTNDQSTIITKPVFEAIYESVDISTLNRTQAAKKLADVWIEQTEYVKK